MASEDDTFRIRPGKVRDRGGVRPVRVRQRARTFIGQVHQAIRRAGGNPNRLSGTGTGSGRFNARGRGAAMALALKERSAWSQDASGARTRARRVAVKVRVVKLNPQRGAARGRQFVSCGAVDAHLRYLERDGVNREGEKGQVYSAERDVADGRAFLDRGRDDRHQFRFIVSVEDGVELSDLRQTTRDLMRTMETDLGTKLDWIAVDHHNTGHPHSHILVRGVTDDGKILNIAGDYIAHAIRERASEIVTLELGRQTEQEVTRQLEREVDAERFTRLDRMLIAEQGASSEFTADLRPADRNILSVADDHGIYRPSEHLAVARDQADHLRQDPETFVKMHVRRLEALRRAGIVERIDDERWRVPSDLPERGLAHDLARDGADARVNILSPLRLEQQIGHDGATWLDRTMIGGRDAIAQQGVGADVRAAWDRRKHALVDMGHATAMGDGSFRAPKNLIERLEQGDLERTGKALATERGRHWQPAVPGTYVAGQLVGSTQLSSGRFAMIDDGLGFRLVPWQPALDKRLGQHISGVAMPGGGVDWSFGRSRGLGL